MGVLTMSRLSAVLFALCFLFSASAHAAAERYEFDKAHTQILFFVNHLGFSNSQGEFHDYDGYIDFNQQSPESSYVEVDIKTASIDMDDEKWDDHMKNSDFFDVENHPLMQFKSTEIEITGENTANINGELTLLGITKPVSLQTTFNKAGVHPFNNKYIAGFSARTVIKRSEWGMNYGLPVIGDEVEIMLEVEGIRQQPSMEEIPE
jgi:polyisoprenoid-binding protein YceI